MIGLLIIVATLTTLEASPDWGSALVNYGGLGIAFGLLVFGRGLHTNGEVQALNDRIASLEKQLGDEKREHQKDMDRKDDIIKAKDDLLDAVRFQITDRAIPALARNSEVLEAIPQGEFALTNVLANVLDKVDKLTTRLDNLGDNKEG